MTKNFAAYENALKMVRELAPVVRRLKKADGDLYRQLRKAGSSVLLNLQEGEGRTGKDRRYHFSVALGSAQEVRGALDVAEAWGDVSAVELEVVRKVLDRQVGLLWGLVHGPRRQRA